jgi:hypothetical protein
MIKEGTMNRASKIRSSDAKNWATVLIKDSRPFSFHSS